MTYSLTVVYVVRKRIKLRAKKDVFIFVENMLPPTVEKDSYNSVFFTWRCQRLECALDLSEVATTTPTKPKYRSKLNLMYQREYALLLTA
nr:hypothetical protein [Tanacetum cinerariifolium]